MVRTFAAIAIMNILACGTVSSRIAEMNERPKPLLILCVVAFPTGVRAYIRGVSTKLVY